MKRISKLNLIGLSLVIGLICVGLRSTKFGRSSEINNAFIKADSVLPQLGLDFSEQKRYSDFLRKGEPTGFVSLISISRDNKMDNGVISINLMLYLDPEKISETSGNFKMMWGDLMIPRYSKISIYENNHRYYIFKFFVPLEYLSNPSDFRIFLDDKSSQLFIGRNLEAVRNVSKASSEVMASGFATSSPPF